jgi:hypothetical protein
MGHVTVYRNRKMRTDYGRGLGPGMSEALRVLGIQGRRIAARWPRTAGGTGKHRAMRH